MKNMNQRINKRIIPDITRDIAEWRSQFHQCPLVLGSATPSLESYARTEKGVYQLLTLLQGLINRLYLQ